MPAYLPFHRWKREFGMIDVNQAKRKKEIFEGKRAVASACAQGEVTSKSDTIFGVTPRYF